MRLLKYSLFVLLIAAGCSTKTTTTGTSASPSGKYSEDLSVLRPKPESTDTAKNNTSGSADMDRTQRTKYVEAKFAVNASLDAVLDSISEQNLALGLVDGFTIQVYSGLKREDALNVKKQMATALPDLEAEVQYAQPNFRVRAGKYFDRYAAQKDYQVIKRHFPNAIILPERVPINE
jgi:hypothetical protein